MNQPEFTIDQILNFDKKGFQSIAARMVRSLIEHNRNKSSSLDRTVEELEQIREWVDAEHNGAVISKREILHEIQRRIVLITAKQAHT